MYLWPGQHLSLDHLFPGVPLSSPTQASLVTSSCSMAKGPWPWLEAVSELSCLTGILPPSLFLLLRMSAWASCPMGNSSCAADLQESATFLARTSAPVWQSYHSNYDALKGWRRDFVSVVQSLAHLPLVRWWLFRDLPVKSGIFIYWFWHHGHLPVISICPGRERSRAWYKQIPEIPAFERKRQRTKNSRLSSTI